MSVIHAKGKYCRKVHVFLENYEIFTVDLALTKGQLDSEWIYEVIVSPKMPTKNYLGFYPGSLLEGKAKSW